MSKPVLNQLDLNAKKTVLVSMFLLGHIYHCKRLSGVGSHVSLF